jgi:hypothetical protein
VAQQRLQQLHLHSEKHTCAGVDVMKSNK